MASVEDLLSVAEAEVGNTSGQKYWDWYRDKFAPWLGEYVNGAITAYCAIFCTWVLYMACVECPWFPNTYAFDSHDDLKGRMVSKYDLRRGDFLAFDWDTDGYGDHVGIVTGVYDWGVATIEGNTSGGVVARCQRVWDNINCGVRPWYSEEDDDMTHEQMEELSDMIADKLVEVLPRANAEYVYGDADKAENLNLYNQSRWSFEFLKRIAQKLGA